MNYLAHLYLSGNNPEIMVGNFIGDYVKGRNHNKYIQDIQKGIILHRRIDSFTDKHPLVKINAEIFRPLYQRYSLVVIDIVMDHILAKNWERYSEIELKTYVNKAHQILMRRYFSLPPKVKQFLPFLIKSRRLENYQHIEGISKTLNIMATHSSLPNHSIEAVRTIEAHYPFLEENFFLFFDEIRLMSAAFIADNITANRSDCL
ncbi:acyl carrier protein phosphodiesterase [Geofilum sp. OHC36d9]|uniref:acyl carrier protein phosphodiesterase n=1 Tax=Geofilum sp. OHC36d9 TaxID=3458413 RepID=UPI004033D09F